MRWLFYSRTPAWRWRLVQGFPSGMIRRRFAWWAGQFFSLVFLSAAAKRISRESAQWNTTLITFSISRVLPALIRDRHADVFDSEGQGSTNSISSRKNRHADDHRIRAKGTSRPYAGFSLTPASGSCTFLLHQSPRFFHCKEAFPNGCTRGCLFRCSSSRKEVALLLIHLWSLSCLQWRSIAHE